MASPFDILGVDPGTDDEAVVEAYRQRVKESHPDAGGSTSEFIELQRAYEQIQAGAGTEQLEPAPGEGEAEHQPSGSRIEYLNYEVLAEHGWSLDDDDLFEKASAAGLGDADYGRFLVEPDESLLEAAENRGFAWPFACRGGACANCAIAVVQGELSMPGNNILTSELIDRGFRLSCNGIPITDEMRIVYNVKDLPGLDELRLPPYPFERAHASD